jgi:hypothetical protein
MTGPSGFESVRVPVTGGSMRKFRQLASNCVLWGAIAFSFVAVGCASAVSQPPPAGPSQVEYEIYSIVLDTIFSESTRDTFYVRETTYSLDSESPTGYVPRVLREILSVSPELIEAYVAANADTLQFEADRFQTQRPVVLIGSGPVDLLISFSRIGFSADGSEAVVHYVGTCGVRCGGGYVRRLEKVDGSWVFREGSETMVF